MNYEISLDVAKSIMEENKKLKEEKECLELMCKNYQLECSGQENGKLKQLAAELIDTMKGLAAFSDDKEWRNLINDKLTPLVLKYNELNQTI